MCTKIYVIKNLHIYFLFWFEIIIIRIFVHCDTFWFFIIYDILYGILKKYYNIVKMAIIVCKNTYNKNLHIYFLFWFKTIIIYILPVMILFDSIILLSFMTYCMEYYTIIWNIAKIIFFHTKIHSIKICIYTFYFGLKQ